MAFTGIRRRDATKTSSTFKSLGSILKENRLPSGGLSRFANVLLQVATQLTKDDFAIMKLGLVANDHLLAKNADSITCAADLLTFMYLKKFISKDDMDLLKDLLVKVQRMDLHDIVDNYLKQPQCGEWPRPSTTIPQQEEASADSYVYGQQCSALNDKMKETICDSMEDDTDLPNSQNSQSSLSDDDKIYQLEKRKLITESSQMDTNSQ